MNDRTIRLLFSTASILLIFLVWQLYSIRIDNPTLMPSVPSVLVRMGQMITDFDTYRIILSSLLRLFTSLVIAVLLGTSLGLASGVNNRIEAFLKPIIVSVRTLPVISIIIVLLIVLGSTATLYVITLLLLFPIIYQAVMDGVKQIDPLLVDVVRLDSDHSNKDVLRNVYLPLSLPFLRSALIDAVGLGFKVLVISEYIAQTDISIGREIYSHKVNLEFTDVFAWTLLLLLFVLLFQMIVEALLKPNINV